VRVDDLGHLWETPAREEDGAAARGGVDHFDSIIIFK
jgi:hypothetical protein